MFEAVAELMAQRVERVEGTDDGSLCPSDADVLAAVDELVRLGRRVDAAAARLLAVADSRGSSDIVSGHRTATWVSHTTRDPKGAAHRRLRAGRGCRRLPLVADAWADGRLSIDHVTVMSRAVANPRVADHVIGLQDLLVERAQEVPFETWRNEVLAIVDTLDVDGSFRPDHPDAPSVLHLSPLFDGTTRLHAELSPAGHAVVAKALNDEADLLFRRYTRDRDHSGGATDIPPRAQLLAEALVSLCRRATAVDLETTAPAHTEAVIVIHTDTPHTATINGNGAPIPTRHLLGLLSDANWRRIILDAQGEVLDLGRTRRLATPAQRRALDIRDGGCVFPGCDAPASWCDAHHLTRWDDNGDTDLANLVLLCRHHHGVVHRRGWTWTHDPTHGRIRWTTPHGVDITSQRHRQPPGTHPITVDNRSDAAHPDAESSAFAPSRGNGRPRWVPPNADPDRATRSDPAPPHRNVA